MKWSKNVINYSDFPRNRIVGEDKLLSLYAVVAHMENQDCAAMESGWDTMCHMLGEGNEGLVDRVIQLVVADTHFLHSN